MNVYWSSFMVAMMSVVGLGTPALAGTDSAVFNFTATFVGGGCEISVPEAFQFNNGDILTFADIREATKDGTPKTTINFNVILKNCSGWGLTPKITVTGNKTTEFGSTLFRESGPKAPYGFGVYMRTEGNRTFSPNMDLGETPTIEPIEWSKNDDLSEIDTVLPIRAVIRCGDCRDDVNYRGGDFKAVVTFNFVYD